MLITKRRRQEGVARLLQAPADLIHSGAPVFALPPDGKGSAAHRQLFSRYARDMNRRSKEALEWWEETVESAVEEAGNRKRGTDEAWMMRPAGPAACPVMVALVRQYWLACHQQNGLVPVAQRVPPEVFLLQWLIDAGKDDAVEMLACMPYWPIGMDHEGAWV